MTNRLPAVVPAALVLALVLAGCASTGPGASDLTTSTAAAVVPDAGDVLEAPTDVPTSGVPIARHMRDVSTCDEVAKVVGAVVGDLPLVRSASQFEESRFVCVWGDDVSRRSDLVQVTVAGAVGDLSTGVLTLEEMDAAGVEEVPDADVAAAAGAAYTLTSEADAADQVTVTVAVPHAEVTLTVARWGAQPDLDPERGVAVAKRLLELG